jgi:hypothetical protein
MQVRYAVVAVLLAVPLLPVPAPAQTASPTPQTQMQLEANRKRLVVRPPAPVDAATRDAEQAADQAAINAATRNANDPVQRATDYDVTSAIQARRIPHR